MFNFGPKTPLPPSKYRMGGKHFKNDKAFIRTSVKDVKRLEKYCGLNTESAVLDWGCGAGRLAIGIKEHLKSIRDYHGVDVQRELIDWCQVNLAGPGYRFTFVDVSNERYNPDGSPERTLSAEAHSVDVFYAYSVFSHMNAADTAGYLEILGHTLTTTGKAFVTCFVEEDVPDWEENPAGYGPLEWKGRLHCTRFSRQYFESLVNSGGLAVDRYEYGRETDGQSLYILRRR